MSFTNYIKHKQIFDNYRKTEKMTRELSHTNYKVKIKPIGVYNYNENEKNNFNNRILTSKNNNLHQRNKAINILTSRSNDQMIII